MFRPRFCLAALLAAMFVPSASGAETISTGPYASLSGVFVVPSDSSISGALGGYTVSADLEMEDGFGLLSSFGYRTEVGYWADVIVQGELELGVRQSDLGNFDGIAIRGGGVTASSPDKIAVDGDLRTLSLMVNGILAFDAWKLRPYMGIGVGLARHDSSTSAQTFIVNRTAVSVTGASEDDIVFAYQAMAGISYPMTKAVEARLGIRHFATGDGDFGGTQASYETRNAEMGVLVRF